MDPTPIDPLAHAPMLRALHEAHPEVDIVVLPEPARAPAPSAVLPGGSPDEERAETERVATWITGALTAHAPEGVVDHRPTWDRGEGPGTVRPVITDRLARDALDAPEPALDRADSVLSIAGWAPRRARTGRTPRLHAEHSGRSLRLAVLDDVLLLTVRGRAVRADAETARSLLTGRGSDHE